MKDPKKTPEDENWQPTVSPRTASVVFGGMLLVILLAALDQTIVSTALPRIVGDLHGLESYSWVATAYMLASTITVPIYGKVSDIIGRKKVMLFGIVVFLCGSAWCGFAHSMLELVAARAVQGLGAGALIPVAFATMGHLYSPRDIGKYQGLIAGAFVLASVIGPPVGGWITDQASWRWIFFVNIPVGLIAATVLVLWMPSFASTGESRKVNIDWIGAFLLMCGLSMLLLALDGHAALAVGGGSILMWLGGAGVLTLLAFIAHQYRVDEPIMNPRLFTGNNVVGVSALITMTVGGTMIASSYYMPLFLQVVLGYSATGSGNMMLPFSIATGIGSVVSGYLTSRTGRYRYVTIGGALMLNAGLLLIAFNITADATITGVVVATVLAGFGLGVGVSLYGTIVRNAVSMNQLGQAQAGLTLFRQMGGTVGMTIAGSLMNAQIAGATLAELSPATRATFATGLHHVYVCLFVVSLVATALTLVLKEVPLRASTHDE